MGASNEVIKWELTSQFQPEIMTGFDVREGASASRAERSNIIQRVHYT